VVVPPTPVREPAAVSPVALPASDAHVGPARQPAPGTEPRPDAEAGNTAIAAAYDEARLRILRSLERGEIDVAEAGGRLEALDGIDPIDVPAQDAAASVPTEDRPPGVDPGSDTSRFDTGPTTDG